MSVLDWLELEERVGTLWHRLIGEAASYPRHPDAAVGLEEMRGALAVFFRAAGGDPGVKIARAAARTSYHRLSLRQRLAMDDERLAIATLDESSLFLPHRLNLFPTETLNRDLYFWLAAFLPHLSPSPSSDMDPWNADLDRLRRAAAATDETIARFPGLASRYRALADALLTVRPQRRLSRHEAHMEQAVQAVLRGRPVPGDFPPPPGRYRPFLPVPLWGETVCRPPQPCEEEADQLPLAGNPGTKEPQAGHAATRRRQDQAERKDSLILNRFEKILSFADMVNVNRATEDTDEEEARKAADSMEEMVLARQGRNAAVKLKFDLDLPPSATDPAQVTGTHLYPEWDYRVQAYRPDHCSVLTAIAAERGEHWEPDETVHRRIRAVKRQFEALRSRPVIFRRLIDGAELDMDAAVRAQGDRQAGGYGSDLVWQQRRAHDRDLAVTVLIDASLSTDSWIENRRVLDVEKEALTVLGAGLAASGDDFSILSFTSRKRNWVRVESLKSFSEPFGPPVMRRIGALKPGYYTRIGTAVRHAAKELEERPNRHRLLLVLTDGKPNDVDHYEGRYGIEDTRHAILDARAMGVAVFGITVDQKAQSYFPHLFGRGGFAIVHHLSQLSAALPRLYRQVAMQ